MKIFLYQFFKNLFIKFSQKLFKKSVERAIFIALKAIINLEKIMIDHHLGQVHSKHSTNFEREIFSPNISQIAKSFQKNGQPLNFNEFFQI